MKKTLIFLFAIFAILAIVGCSSNVPAAKPVDSNPPNDNQVVQAKMENGLQSATLSWGKLNYQPSTIRVKQGVMFKLTADTDKLQGCYSSIVIPEFNVDKAFTKNDDSVEFMPDKKGSFNFACGMGMGRGTLIVE